MGYFCEFAWNSPVPLNRPTDHGGGLLVIDYRWSGHVFGQELFYRLWPSDSRKWPSTQRQEFFVYILLFFWSIPEAMTPSWWSTQIISVTVRISKSSLFSGRTCKPQSQEQQYMCPPHSAMSPDLKHEKMNTVLCLLGMFCSSVARACGAVLRTCRHSGTLVCSSAGQGIITCH